MFAFILRLLPPASTREGLTVTRPRTVQAEVVHRLGSGIVCGAFSPGSALPTEPQLCVSMSVSRGIVREAIKTLAAKGLVETRPRTGSRVRARQYWNHFDQDVLAWRQAATSELQMLRSLTEFRRLVEPGAAGLAATRMSPDQLAVLDAAYSSMLEHHHSVADDRKAAFVAADQAFHLALLRSCDNEFLEHLSRVVDVALHMSFDATMDVDDSVASALPLHGKVLEAVKSGDAVLASASMAELIDITARHVEDTALRAGDTSTTR